MVFAIVFLLNAVANFLLGIVLSALLGPAEFGRYATIALGATTLATASFDWLRLSSIRFSGSYEDREATAASLDAGYIAMIGVSVVCVLALLAARRKLGLEASLLALTPFMAIAYARSDYFAALMRARDQGRAFAVLAATRHSLTFTVVICVAVAARSAAPVVAALTATTLISVVAIGPATRTPGARLSLANWQAIERFVVYSKPIVASTVIYLVINLFDRHLALERFGAAETGQLALATDLGLKLFLAINVLPETLLFQYALKRERDEGRAIAERQIAANIVLIFAVLAPLTASYMAMAPTIETVMAPAAYRGEYAKLSCSLAPGFLAFCALYSMCNPVFQLAKKTWPLTLAAVAALIANVVLVQLPCFSADIDGLARAFAISLGVGFAVAAGTAFRQRAIRPAGRDMIVIAAAAGAMGLLMRPLNDIHPPLLAAALSIVLGGAVLASSILIFDVGGLRALAAERLRWLGLHQGIDGRRVG
jgi:O-antigen/teichoic acid export membrane protein